MTFVDFVGPQGLHRDPNGSQFGKLEKSNLNVICNPDGAKGARWLPGSKKESFGGGSEGSGVYFGVIQDEFFIDL